MPLRKCGLRIPIQTVHDTVATNATRNTHGKAVSGFGKNVLITPARSHGAMITPNPSAQPLGRPMRPSGVFRSCGTPSVCAGQMRFSTSRSHFWSLGQ